MTLQLLWLCLQACVFGFAVTWTVLEHRAYRRYRALNALLMQICTQAFMARHVPIWTAWSEMTGHGFRIVPMRRHDMPPGA